MCGGRIFKFPWDDLSWKFGSFKDASLQRRAISVLRLVISFTTNRQISFYFQYRSQMKNNRWWYKIWREKNTYSPLIVLSLFYQNQVIKKKSVLYILTFLWQFYILLSSQSYHKTWFTDLNILYLIITKLHCDLKFCLFFCYWR